VLEFPETFPNLPHGVCGTGDTFETGGNSRSCDLLDMEAYALAKVCWIEGAVFGCAKYVSDGADGAAASDWRTHLPLAAARFLELYQGLRP
jgi:adenosylhomocysteine nucleosidase